MPLYRQDYAGLPEMADVAAQHARALVAERAGSSRARDAEILVRALAATALSRTQPTACWTLTTEVSIERIHFEVWDPGDAVADREPVGNVLSTLSGIADYCGTGRAKGGGRITWGDLFLPVEAATP